MPEKKRIITHNGNFHCDEVFAVASLKMYLDKVDVPYEILRTRNPEAFPGADFLIDVGDVYDPDTERFDHHQEGGAGKRDNGVPYASFGLVWKKYGGKLCGSEKVASIVDCRLVQPIDAMDNGIDIYTPILPDVQPYLLADFLESFRLTWKERGVDLITVFLSVVDMAKTVLEREMKRVADEEEGRANVEAAYAEAKDKRIIVLDNNYPAHNVLNKYLEPLYFVAPDFDNGTWIVMAIRVGGTLFNYRKPFPVAWAAKRTMLAALSGVPDALFCHNDRFIAVARSKEGALKLAETAANAD
jgi:uncharacterized UPF0160 family protein